MHTDRSNKIEGINHNQIHALVVKWISVHKILTCSILHDLETLAIDFSQANAQSSIEVEVCMHLSLGYETGQDEVMILKITHMV